MLSKKIIVSLVVGMVILTGIFMIGSFSRTAISAKTPDSSVGYVDMERIQKEHQSFIDLGVVIKEKESEFNFFKSYLNKQLESFTRELRNKMEQETKGKSTEEQAKIEQKYQEQYQVKNNELNNQLGQKTNEINDFINQKRTAVMDSLRKTIEVVATDMKLTVVLDKSARLYGGTDITQAVLDKSKNNSKTETNNSKKPK